MKSRCLKKRCLLAGYLALVLLWTNAAFATVLNVPQRYQEQSLWAWAGCSQAILEYYGTIKTQTQIAAYGTPGAINTWNYLWGSFRLEGQQRNGIDLILLHFAGLASAHSDSFLSQSGVLNEINARRPFVIRWGWDNGGGHFVVGKGIDGDYVSLMDPWDGPTINTYSWVVHGSSHTWTHTLMLNSAPAQFITGILPLLLAD